MAASTSLTRLINPTDLDEEELIRYIERLRRRKYVSLRQSSTANSQSNDGNSPSDDDSDTFSVFSFKSQEEPGAVTTTRSKNIKVVPCVLSQDDSATAKDNIWGCARFFMTTAGEKYMSHHFSSRPLPCASPRFSHMKYNTRIPSCRPNQGRRQRFQQARPDVDVNGLEEIIKGDDSEHKEILISILQDSVFMLMLSRRLHYLYSMLVDACEGPQLDSLVVRVLSQGKYFLSAAFAKQGASSIIELIRKMKSKSSPHALAMTRVLSTRFMDIMTHPTARDVIVQCLILFPRKSNEVLYEKVILHFQDLAINEVGWKSLINCIALIGGDQRVRLLNQIADVSDYLSYDPYGNYVVQNLLGIKNKDITKKIMRRLHNQFMQLAVIKGGCLVVEKCMEASDDGIIAVAEEILDCRRAALQLARNQYGNYVIQALLKKSKERGFISLYNAIAQQLEPRCRASRRQTAWWNKINSRCLCSDEPNLYGCSTSCFPEIVLRVSSSNWFKCPTNRGATAFIAQLVRAPV
ncbi:UNVERIFIED_CONTAM: putative pumilio21 [Sesamum radiatum]|uniref:Pumilio21 n=1 Tax=Sesamum radiatum TaxID=300843 RepID=A0AAW2TVV0_SESRA